MKTLKKYSFTRKLKSFIEVNGVKYNYIECLDNTYRLSNSAGFKSVINTKDIEHFLSLPYEW